MLQRSMGGKGLLFVGALPEGGEAARHLADLQRVLGAAGVPVRCADARRRPGVAEQAAARARLVAELALGRARGDLLHVHIEGADAASWGFARWAGIGAEDRHGGLDPRPLLTVHAAAAAAFIAQHGAPCRAASAAYRRIVCADREIARALGGAGVEPARLVVAPPQSPGLLPMTLQPAGLAAIRARHAVLFAAAIGPDGNRAAAMLARATAAVRCRAAAAADAALVLFGAGARDGELPAGGPPVYRLGALRRGEALGLVRACDVFIRAESDAIPLREARALGVRAVASDAGLRVEGAIPFRAGDADALAAALLAALAAPRPVPSDGLASLVGLYREAGVLFPDVPCASSSPEVEPPRPGRPIHIAQIG